MEHRLGEQQHGGRRKGAGRPLAHEQHKVKRSVTLSPRAWAIVAAYRAQHRHRSVSETLEAIVRQEQTMSETTTRTATIHIWISEDSLGDADPQYNDIATSHENYTAELTEALAVAYPGSAIEVRMGHGRDVVYWDDSDIASAEDEDLAEAVSELSGRIFERGTFWADPTTDAE
jgi:hypothetical protein